MSAAKNKTRESNEKEEAFARVYAVKGDGIAVLRPKRLKEEKGFVEEITKIYKQSQKYKFS